MKTPIAGYESKERLLVRLTRGKHVLHLGAIGCTLQSTADKLAAAPRSVHALLSSVSTCVGVDLDAEGVRALTEAGVFNNLFAADVNHLRREQIPLPSIDVVVAGDLIEHLSNPGAMLDRVRELSDPHSVLVVTTPNAMGLPNFLRYSLGRYVDSPDHVCTFNVYHLENLLHRHGWALRRMYTCYQPGARERNSRWVFSLALPFLEWRAQWGGTLLAVASSVESRQPGA